VLVSRKLDRLLKQASANCSTKQGRPAAHLCARATVHAPDGGYGPAFAGTTMVMRMECIVRLRGSGYGGGAEPIRQNLSNFVGRR
jgi:thiamine biosynthesis lipoprotein ApbE